MSKIKCGDRVVMTDKYIEYYDHKGEVFTVRSEPHMVCGTEVVWLGEFDGCYAVDGLELADQQNSLGE